MATLPENDGGYAAYKYEIVIICRTTIGMATDLSAPKSTENRYKVKLSRKENGLTKYRVVFDVTPDLTETRTVNYRAMDPIHAPGQIYVYTNTASRQFSLTNVKLVSRTPQEAEINLRKLQQLRSWCMPRFGLNSSTVTFEQSENRRTGEGDQGDEWLGLPPPVLYLSAYSGYNSFGLRLENINSIPVVITSLTIPYQSDVDYINTPAGVPVARIINLDIQLQETHSAIEYDNFNLAKFRAGILESF